MGDLRMQAMVLIRQRVSRRFAPALFGHQGIEFALLLLMPPGREMGRIQPLSTQQRADGAVVAAGLGLGHYRPFVLGSELATLGFLRNLRVGDRNRRGAAGVGSSSAPVWLATLSLPALRSRQLRLFDRQLLEIRLEH